ncbi:MAG: PilC/PilY family type IV pilus protein [Steroidobacteraceae bacterium]
MKSNTLFSTLVAIVLLAFASMSARADDTEIFFNQSNVSVGANVLLILDTSGSMDDEVTSGPDYDGSITYPTSGTCDPAYVYWATNGSPTCTNANRVPVSQFKCASAKSQLGNDPTSSGQYGDAFIRWGSVTTRVGRTSTTVYKWTNSLSVTNGTDVECLNDAGVDGDGVDTTNLWPTKNSDPAATRGIWNNAANSWWAVFGNTGVNVTFYSANYINYVNDTALYVTQAKMKIMQDAVRQLLTSVQGVNVGLMRYDWQGAGGMVMNAMAPIATNATPITNTVNSWIASGNTPLVKTLYEAYLYYAGGAVNYGNTSWSTTCTSTYTSGTGALHCGAGIAFRFNSVAASRTGGSASSNTYDSPMDLSCQKNYIIFLTDGQSNNDDTAINRTIRALPDFGTLGGSCDAAVMPGANGGQCLGALSQYMQRADLRTDVGGKQNVTTYFIGFGDTFRTDPNATAYYNYLSDAATRGGGKAFTATGLSELQAVFNQIFSEVQNINTSFSAPSVAVNAFNRTQTLDDIYVSVFKPSGTYHWPGNIKKYKVTNGMITDSLSTTVSAVDPGTGFFRDAARSFWSSAVDGADVTKGGAAENLPTAASRVIYTYLGANPTTAGSTAAMVSITTAADSDFAIGNTGDPSRVDLLNWIRGQDVLDDNNDGSVTDDRHVMGDPIHTQPAVVIYGTGADDTWLFAPTNDGYLHAINARNGVEHWAYIPKEMLSKLKLLFDNDSSPTKHYALDGQITLIKYDVNGDGSIGSGDRVLLYFGTGRNADTQAYYALDVTDPNNPQFLWMIDDNRLPDLGQAWSPPQVTRVNITGGGVTQNSQKLTLVIGGGYDPVEDGYTYVPADSVGNHIYFVDALYGTLLWNVGNNGSANLQLARMDHSIPSPVTVLDTNGDGYADRMYVGDTAGQLWRFDIFNGQLQTNLVAGGVVASLGSHEESPHLAANTRRFYSAPDVAAIQKTGMTTYMNIAIGSGYRGHPLDTATNDRLYSLRDYNPFTALTQAQYNTLMLAANLTVEANLTDITLLTNPTIPSNSKGWYLKLNQHGAGEKDLVPARTFNDQIFFTTYTPTIQASSDPCEGVGSGINRSYIISVFNGSAAIDRNHDGTMTNDERSSDLSQGGIAPETTFLFPASDGTDGNGNQNGGQTGGSRGPVVCLQGVEVLSACTNYDRRKKTYWREGSAQ